MPRFADDLEFGLMAFERVLDYSQAQAGTAGIA
jgi:hypothetical protein